MFELHVEYENQKLINLMKLLKIFTGQEIQAFQKAVTERFELIEELVRTYKQKEEVQAKDLISTVPLIVRDPRVLDTYTSEKPANTQYPNRHTEYKWKPIGIKDLKEIKQVVVSYGIHSPFVSEMVKIWASAVELLHMIGLVLALLEDRLRLQRKCYWREEAEAWNIKVESKDLRLPKIKFTVRAIMLIHRVKLFTMNKYILFLCYTAILNAWDSIQRQEEELNHIKRSHKAQKNPLVTFLQRLTKTVPIGVADSENR